MLETTESSHGLSSSPSSSTTSSSLLFHMEMRESGLRQPEPSLGINKRSQRLLDGPDEVSKYLIMHKRATLHRLRVGAGRSRDMARLYKYWVSFLPQQFNQPMYDSFKTYAEEDAAQGHTGGLKCLFTFFAHALHQEWDDELYRDLETLALRYEDYLGYDQGMHVVLQLLTAHNPALYSFALVSPGPGVSLKPLPWGAQASAQAPPAAGLTVPILGEHPCPSAGKALGVVSSADGMISRAYSVASAASSTACSEVLDCFEAALATARLPSGLAPDPRVLEQIHIWQRVSSWQAGHEGLYRGWEGYAAGPPNQSLSPSDSEEYCSQPPRRPLHCPNQYKAKKPAPGREAASREGLCTLSRCGSGSGGLAALGNSKQSHTSLPIAARPRGHSADGSKLEIKKREVTPRGVGAAPGACLPTGARTKRTRARVQTGLEVSTSWPVGGSSYPPGLTAVPPASSCQRASPLLTSHCAHVTPATIKHQTSKSKDTEQQRSKAGRPGRGASLAAACVGGAKAQEAELSGLSHPEWEAQPCNSSAGLGLPDSLF